MAIIFFPVSLPVRIHKKIVTRTPPGFFSLWLCVLFRQNIQGYLDADALLVGTVQRYITLLQLTPPFGIASESHSLCFSVVIYLDRVSGIFFPFQRNNLGSDLFDKV
jgi:hypothetical protein